MILCQIPILYLSLPSPNFIHMGQSSTYLLPSHPVESLAVNLNCFSLPFCFLWQTHHNSSLFPGSAKIPFGQASLQTGGGELYVLLLWPLGHCAGLLESEKHRQSCHWEDRHSPSALHSHSSPQACPQAVDKWQMNDGYVRNWQLYISGIWEYVVFMV